MFNQEVPTPKSKVKVLIFESSPKAMYGLLVLNDSSIDDMTAKEGLQLTREPTKYTVDTFNIQETN